VKLHLSLKTVCVGVACLLMDLPRMCSGFMVVGYTTSWSGSVDTIQYGKVTHLNYSFLLPNSDGSVQAIDNPSKLQSLVSTSHGNGVKVLISVGGWMNGDPSPFVNLSGNGTARANFVNNLVNFVNQYGLDGVDIDWEVPTSDTSTLYGTLMSDLARAMHSRGKLLTSAVTASGGGADPIPGSIFNLVDWLNIMDYDQNNFDHSTYASAVTALDYWNGRGLPPSKAVLGVPFYSHPGSYTYAQLLSMGASPNSDTWNGQGYNGIPTIQSKTNLCFDRGAGGIMMWELAQDTTDSNSLLSAIDQVVKQRQITFTQWADAHFNAQQLANPAISGPAAIPLNDRIPNLLKYFFAINPVIPMGSADYAAMPIMGIDTTTTPGTQYLTLTYRQTPSATGFTVNLQASTDMINWQTVTPDISQNMGTDPLTTYPIIRVGNAMTGAPQKYLRLNITMP